jgi:hypothetical protein
MTELWRPIPGFADYEASSLGRIRSWRNNHAARRSEPRVMRPRTNRYGYPAVKLYSEPTRFSRVAAHRAVLLAFVGPRPEGMETRHLNGDKLDNRLENLAYGTAQENALDRVRLGEHHYARRDACKHGHPFDAANTYRRSDGGRGCCECRRQAGRRHYARHGKRTTTSALAAGSTPRIPSPAAGVTT